MIGKYEEFYPTPPALIEKMLKGIDFKYIGAALEPSAGKGNIAEELNKKICEAQWRKSEDDKGSVDCIEIQPDLQNMLRGKGYRVIHDDFLSFRTNKHYDLIVMNPPFSNGDEHLLHALNLMQYGGTIVCILNSQTLKNPCTKVRQILWNQLNKYSAQVQYLQDEFVTAERVTKVEIALIHIEIPKPEKKSFIFEDLKTKSYENIEFECRDLVGGGFIEQIVKQYEMEVEAGVRLINEYKAMLPYIRSSFDNKNDDSPTLVMNLSGERSYSASYITVNKYVEAVRLKYWNELLRNKNFNGMLTSNLQDELYDRVRELKAYDFSVFNIKKIQKQMLERLCSGIEDTIMTLFDKLSAEHAYYPECKNNIHYYSGWKTNKAHKINKKVIIPIYGAFSSYSWSQEAFEVSTVFKVMQDLEKTLSYLETGETIIVDDLLERLKICATNGTTRNIQLRYFKITLYKKGTCHIEFTDLDLLERLNIYGSQRKGWLPPFYGKKAYSDMTDEEKVVINEFQGKDTYEKVYNCPAKYIIEPSQMLMLTMNN